MSDKLSQVKSRLETVHQLGSVVNAMAGMAAARMHQAQGQLAAVEQYASSIVAAMQDLLASEREQVNSLISMNVRSASARAGSQLGDPVQRGNARRLLVVFCAEQGFAGAFSEQVLESLTATDRAGDIFLVGTRGASVAAERGLQPCWTGVLPSHSPAIPTLARVLTDAVFSHIALHDDPELVCIFTRTEGPHTLVQRQRLFPVELPTETSGTRRNAPPLQPITHRPLAQVIDALGTHYIHARFCAAALNAFAAENAARMTAMVAARSHVERDNEELQALERRLRQESITDELLELVANM